MPTKRVGRNDLCPCGSGRKYKQCCLRKANLGASVINPNVQFVGISHPTPKPPLQPVSSNSVVAPKDHPALPPPGSTNLLPVELGLHYTFQEDLGIAEVTHVVPAGRVYELADGTRIVNDDLEVGMQFRLQDGKIGTLTRIEHVFEPPRPPVHLGNGLVQARVVGTIKHKGYASTEVAWQNNTVTASSDHKFYSLSRQTYVPAEKLAVGEFLKGDDGFSVPISSVGEKKLGLVDFYNIEVEHYHNYHVGTNPSVVPHI